MVGMDNHLKDTKNVIIEEESGKREVTEVELLESFGYKQEMNKNLSVMSNFAVAFGCCSILSGLTPLWGDAMMSGGSVSVIWGFLLVAIFTFGVGLSLAEICSAFPIAGGLYIWTSQLAPKKIAPLACFVTGYMNWLGLSVAITSTDLALAQFLGSVINMQYPDYVITKYWEFGIFLVVVFIHGVINSASIKYNGIFNQVSLYWHLIGTLLLIIVILVLTPNKPSAEWVFTYFENDTGFSNPGYGFLIGLLQCQYTLSGYDSAAQLSEESKDSATTAPKGIIYAIGSAAIVGFAFLLSVNFCVQDFQTQIVETSITPMVQVFLDGVGNKWTIVLCVIIMGAQFFSGSALTLGSSRMVYAFSRDGAFPLSKYVSKVNKFTMTPVFAVWTNIIFAAVVGILYIINDTAYNAIVSVNTIASSLAYFIPIFLRLTVSRKKFVRGPFHLGPFSEIIGWISCFWIIFTFILFVCPTEYPVTPDNMNYAIVIFSFVIFASVSYYFLRARKWFKGPTKSREPDAFMDEGLAIEETKN
ncbi:unnamed protein product [Cunninghamella blakesleeana]